jgi:hypothetical protein
MEWKRNDLTMKTAELSINWVCGILCSIRLALLYPMILRGIVSHATLWYYIPWYFAVFYTIMPRGIVTNHKWKSWQLNTNIYKNCCTSLLCCIVYIIWNRLSVLFMSVSNLSCSQILGLCQTLFTCFIMGSFSSFYVFAAHTNTHISHYHTPQCTF